MTLLLGLGCAHPSGDATVETAQHVDYAAPVLTLPLAGARCQGGECRCRRLGDNAETQPPAPNHKRFEIRVSVGAGEIDVASPTLGHFRHVGKDGTEEQCVYLDLPAGSEHQFTIESREANKGEGMTPSVHIAEWGPKGPYWYDVISVRCGLGDRRCNREFAEAWRDEWLTHRKRGRWDACGSTVVSALRWDTSGGLHARDGGLLRDFRVQFLLQVKAFATELPPNSPQCVPQ
jgi:hypothetical protein